jgi:hypothetical protein
MTFKIIEIEDSIRNMGFEMPVLSICDGSPATFSMLRPQFKENLKYNDTNGVWIENPGFLSLCESTIKICKEKFIDLLITPEYSFSYETVYKIVLDKTGDFRPDYGKLWCICCQGITGVEFKQYIEKFQKEAIVVEDALNTMVYREFVNALFYIFIDENNQLFLVPQIKTQSMSDSHSICEGAGLTQGCVIYKFGKNYTNQLVTLICADVFRFVSGEISQLTLKTPTENLILLHPQLNAHPRHESFSAMRDLVYKIDHYKNMIYITSNWAAGTMLIDAEDRFAPKKIITPWSAIYIKDKDKQWFESEKKLRLDNDVKALSFGYQNKNQLKVWYGYIDELSQKIVVKKPATSVAAVLVPKLDVQVKSLYLKDNNEWVEVNDIVRIDNLGDITGIEKHDEYYGYPIRENKVHRDVFFGISLGSSEKEQLFLDDTEITLNVGTFVDEQCDESRKKRLHNFKKLKSLLQDKKLPVGMDDLNQNHKFDLMEDSFNVISKDGSHEMIGMIAYVSDETDAKKVSQEFKEKLKKFSPIYDPETNDFDSFKNDVEMYQNNKKICILYCDDHFEICSYPKRNTDIKNPDKEIDEISITR